MRGLDIRVAYATGKVHATYNSLRGTDEMLEATFDAESYGYADFLAGEDNVPLMFVDEPSLAQSWGIGWSFAYDLEISRECPDCQNSTGNPCSSHG